MMKKILNSNIIWSIVAILVNTAINFCVVPYVSENVGVEAYGFVTLANTLITYIDVISVALNSFASRYIAMAYHEKNFEKARKYYSSIFIANIILSVIFLVLGTVIILNLQNVINVSLGLEHDVKILFFIVLGRYICTLLRNAFDVSTFIKNRLDLTEKLRAFSYIIQAIILLVTCVSMKPHVWYVGIASFVAALIMLLVQYVFTKRLTHELKVKTLDFSVKCIKDFLVNGIWNAINNIGNLLNSGLDLLITNKMLTELLMGMVSVSKTLGSLCYTLVVAISSSFRPKQLEAYSHKDKEKLIELLKNSMLITGTVCAIILAGFNACGEDFLHLWLPSQNHEILFQLAMITLMSDILIGVVNPLYYVFTLTKKLKVPCLITIIMGILNITGMYALIKYTDLGVYAVVLTTMVLNCVHFIDTPLYASYCLNIKMITFYPVIILHFINTAVLFLWTSLINCYWPNVYSWAMLLVKVIFSGITEMIIVVVLMTTTEQKKQLLKILGKYVKRKVRGQ